MFNRRVAGTLVVCVLAVFGAAAVVSAQALDLDAIRAGKRLTAVRITEPIRIDGLLDEPVWQRAEAATEFFQQIPDEYQPSRRRTEVRFLYDATTLYVGAMLYDDEPSRLVTNDLIRDFNAFDSDSLGLVFDTFHDRNNSYGFLVNVGGAMRDTLGVDRGRRNDATWDGVWTTRTAVLPNGWSLELAIPFKTLRFKNQQTQEWGLNMLRVTRSGGINERSVWSPVPRQFLQYNVTYAGVLLGLEGIRPGRNLFVKPFATSQIRANGNGTPLDKKGDGGIDLKWGITPSLLLDGSYRTDFSQVEADAQQINLTRFSLFFPEKREFFLENPGSYQIGLIDESRRDLVPFFTRRIGLVSGQPVPVVGGLRLTGQAGGQSVGMLNMQTEETPDHSGDNFTAMIVKRPLSPTTTLGGFYFGREAVGTVKGETAFNRVAGGDFRYSPNRTFDLEAFAMHSNTAGRPDDWAGRVGFLLSTTKNRARVAWVHTGDAFQHDLGFIQRPATGTVFGNYTRIVQPSTPSSRIQQHDFSVNLALTENADYSQSLTRITGGSYRLGLKDGGSFTTDASTTFEHLISPFKIGSVTVPVGEYQNHNLDVTYQTNTSAVVSGNVGVEGGRFWEGRQITSSGRLRVRMNAHVAASATFSRSDVKLTQGSYAANLVGMRLDWSFTPRMFLNAFVQYNGDTDTWLSNIRYNFIHRPLSDIYVVWNETKMPAGTQRAILLKYTHMIAF